MARDPEGMGILPAVGLSGQARVTASHAAMVWMR
jgi:hypothetical protein